MGNKKELILIKDSDDEEDLAIDPSYAIFVEKMVKDEEKVRLKKASSDGASKHKRDLVKNPITVGPSEKHKMVPVKNYSEGSSKRLVKRGPYRRGSCIFDKESTYGNDMEFDESQCEHLEDFCRECPGVPIKYYLYKMTCSAVDENKGKMEFALDFTNKYLKGFLEDPEEVLVQCTNRNKSRIVKMKLGESSGRAMLSGGWAKAAEYFRLKEGEIYLFSFTPAKRHVLEIMLVHI